MKGIAIVESRLFLPIKKLKHPPIAQKNPEKKFPGLL
jgi:hypothetical protein